VISVRLADVTHVHGVLDRDLVCSCVSLVIVAQATLLESVEEADAAPQSTPESNVGRPGQVDSPIGAVKSPSADVTPTRAGYDHLAIPTFRATATRCTGPAPPNANSV